MSAEQIRILLIDDDADDYFLICDHVAELRDARYRVDRAASYEDGIEALRTGGFDVCLLDYRLGARTGLELLQEAQSLPAICPIIILTGQGDSELDMKAMQAGAADYLVKDRLSAELVERSIRYAIKNAGDLSDLWDQTENFKALFDSMFEGILVHDGQRIVDANAASGRIFGCSAAQLIGAPISSCFASDGRGDLRRSLESGNAKACEIVAVRRDGDEVPVEISTKTVSLRGGPLSLTSVHDLSERKRMEAQILQQDRLASLGLLASSLAHEIGTPMGVIRGRAEMLGAAASASPESAQKSAQLIISQVDRITELIHSVLKLARGQQSGAISVVEVRPVLNDVLHLLGHEFLANRIELQSAMPTELTVNAEAGPLGQVFLNLLINAVHAIKEARTNGRMDGHFISVSASIKAGATEVKIRDTGCGISEKDRKSLFKPFFTTRAGGGGTGLGLAISEKILRSWGASIHVESALGSGATFSLKFPPASEASSL